MEALGVNHWEHKLPIIIETLTRKTFKVTFWDWCVIISTVPCTRGCHPHRQLVKIPPGTAQEGAPAHPGLPWMDDPSFSTESPPLWLVPLCKAGGLLCFTVLNDDEAIDTFQSALRGCSVSRWFRLHAWSHQVILWPVSRCLPPTWWKSSPDGWYPGTLFRNYDIDFVGHTLKAPQTSNIGRT